jgi:hypothetical protein
VSSEAGSDTDLPEAVCRQLWDRAASRHPQLAGLERAAAAAFADP